MALNAVIVAIGILAGIIHVLMRRKQLSKEKQVELLLLYFLVFAVGWTGIIAFVGHVFYPEMIAPMIGWQVSPFQREVGLHDGAWGLLAILAIWIRGSFWHAVVIGWSFFMLGAGLGHLTETITAGNYATYNYGMIFMDIGSAVILLALWLRWIMLQKHK